MTMEKENAAGNPAAVKMAECKVSAQQTQEYLSFAKDVALEGGKMIRHAFQQPRENNYGRKSATDPVTETDHAVEAYIVGRIRQQFPSHKVIGEESASQTVWTDDATWIVDPIDGTANCTCAHMSFFPLPSRAASLTACVGAHAQLCTVSPCAL